MPQLDTLRFFVVIGVMVTHNWHLKRLPWLFGDLDWGGLGVRLFFVLSGFLITGILIKCREMADAETRTSRFYIRQFYIRRILRIFPIYYLTIFLAFVFDVPGTREVWGWLATYTSNVYITLNNTWIARMGHFWSLAVEEHFY
jgi:peptidoglycan/LPS O-acetylase OafA/YrhL